MNYDSSLEFFLRREREVDRMLAALDPLHSLSDRVALGFEPRYRDHGMGSPSVELACASADPLGTYNSLLPRTASAILAEADQYARNRELADSLIHKQALDATAPMADYLCGADRLARIAAGEDYHDNLRRIAGGNYYDSVSAWVEGSLWQPPPHSLLSGLNNARLADINATIEPWRHRPGYAESFSALAMASDAMSATGGSPDSYRPLIGDIRDLVFSPDFESSPQSRLRSYLDAGFNPTLLKPSQKALVGMFGINGFIEPSLWRRDGHIIVPARKPLRARVKDFKLTPLERKAYKELGELERWLRAFIDEEMSAVYGEDWYKTHAPKKLMGRINKMNLGNDDITGIIVLDDADFAHYLEIILDENRWSDVFIHIFGDHDETAVMLKLFKKLRLSVAHYKGFCKADFANFLVCFRWFEEKIDGSMNELV